MFVPTRATLHGMPAILALFLSGCGFGGMSSAPKPVLTPQEWITRLRSEDARTRAEAGAALASQASAAIEPLLTLLADGQAPVDSRLYALDCLGKVTGTNRSIHAAVVQTLRDANPDLQQQAVRFLVDGQPPSKLSITDLRSLTVDAHPVVLREFGDWLAAEKVQTAATSAELASLIDDFCQRSSWNKESPAVALGLFSLLSLDPAKISPGLANQLLTTFDRTVKRIPESRVPFLNARLSEVTGGIWLLGPHPSAAKSRSHFPAADEQQAEVQTIELACELAKRVFHCGHIDTRHVRALYRRSRSDPFRVLAERAAVRMGSETVLNFHMEALVAGDLVGRREALAVLSAQTDERLESFKPLLYQSLLPLAKGDSDACRTLLVLLLRLGPAPQNAGPVLAQLARHTDKRQSEMALTLISTMDNPPLVDLPLTDTFYQLIDNASGPLASRHRALDQIDRQLALNSPLPGPLRAVLVHVTNTDNDPLRERAEQFLRQRKQSTSGNTLNDLRQKMESFSDLFLQRLEFRSNGQIAIVGWCSRSSTAETSRHEILQTLESSPLIEWARWRQSLQSGRAVLSELVSVEIEVVAADFQSALQADVQQDKGLQGCTILSAQVSSRGNVVLKVLLDQASQRSPLETATQRLTKSPTWATRIPGSIVFLEVATVPTSDLLLKIREACERNKLQIWISGLALEADGRLALTGWSGESENKADEIGERAAEILKDHPLNKYVVTRPPSPATQRVVARLEPMQADWIESLTEVLNQTAHATEVAIDRAYYTATGTLKVEGVQSNPAVFPAVEPVLQAALREPGRQRFLPRGAEFAPFSSQRWDDMAANLQKVILLHPECDGFRITGVTRGSRQEWIFSGTTTSPLTDRRITALMSALTQVSGGIIGSRKPTFKNLDVIERNTALADRALISAITHIAAKEYDEAAKELDIAILHAPDIGVHWHVRGLNLLAQNEKLLARQSLYRAALLETKNLKVLERLQGPNYVQLRSDAISLQREIANHVRNPAWLEKELEIRRFEKPTPPVSKKSRVN